MARNRNIYIDVMRAVAICPVMLAHCAASGLSEDTSTVGQIFSYVGFHGGCGVLLFFVISGFVITRAAMAREHDLFGLSYRTFYPRRFARIFPLFLAVCILGIAVLELADPLTPLYQYVIRDPKAVFDAAFWASLFTFTFNVWRIASVNISLGWGLHWDIMWSLAVEEQFYLAFPLLLYLARNRYRLFAMLSGIILLSAGYRLIYRYSLSPFNSFVCFELIAAGVMAAVYAPRIPPSRLAPLAVLGGVMLCAGFLTPERTLPSFFTQEFIAIGAGILLICSTSARQDRSFVLLIPIALIGELSYGMYLLHPIVIYAIGETLHIFGYIFGYVLLVVATTAVAALSYWYYEKPAERLARRMLVWRTAQVPSLADDAGR